jgi:hypothetical protein
MISQAKSTSYEGHAMSKKTRNDIWINSDEFPDDRDVERFGDDSPYDNDPLTIGYVGRGPYRRRFWTGKRLVIAVVMLILLAAMLGPSLIGLLFRLFGS